MNERFIMWNGEKHQVFNSEEDRTLDLRKVTYRNCECMQNVEKPLFKNNQKKGNTTARIRVRLTSKAGFTKGEQ